MSELQDPEIFRTVLDSLQTGVSVADRSGKILFWNQGAERITGHKRHEVVGRSCRDNILVQCNDQGCAACGATCPISQTLHEGKPQEAKMQLRHKEGYPVHVLMRIAPLRDPHGSIIGIAESFDEQKFESDRDRNRNTLAAHGCMDEVTDIPSHDFTRFRLSENLAGFARYHLPFGVIAIQVDRLENLRANYGRQAGDAVLRVVAQTMVNAFRPSDFLGRWTEDQFLAILINSGDSGVEHTWERIRKMVTCAGLRWWSDELSVTTSVGYATAQAGDTLDSLLNRAQSSLRQSSANQAAGSAVGSHRGPESSEI
jgi:diguanylate cyclase (GGDEF)-like protein/PAS domain S-box-containing protein